MTAQRFGANGVLRLTTCGAVDDGKSTLLGRLLINAGAVFEDHLGQLLKVSESHNPGKDRLDAALLFDGLEAEREQGITIDVAYRFFTTARRKFIIADAPGHEAHTRNMATAASNADLAIVVVDAKRGITPQTLRHIKIAGLVGVRAAILAINKMDKVDYKEAIFRTLSEELENACNAAGLSVRASIPVVARDGDNLTLHSALMPWHKGPTLLDSLEELPLDQTIEDEPLRFGVQYVIKPQPNLSSRSYAGTVQAGRVCVGEEVLIAHAGVTARIARIVTADSDLAQAVAGDAIALVLDTEHDVSRGDVLSSVVRPPLMSGRLCADLIGLGEAGLTVGRRYEFRCGTSKGTASIKSIDARQAFGEAPGTDTHISQNEIARCTLELSKPMPLDLFATCRDTGGFLLVDRHTGETLAAGMVRSLQESNIRPQKGEVTLQDRTALMGHRPAVIWFTGLSGAGKSTIANLVEQKLHTLGVHTFALDGDNLRGGLTRDLGFSPEDRVENIRRAGEVARLFVEAGLVVTCAFISPFRMDRTLVRELIGDDVFLEVFVDAPLDTCIARDPKGLYKRALRGEIPSFSGVSSPYEAPMNPDLHLDTTGADASGMADQVITMLRARGVI